MDKKKRRPPPSKARYDAKNPTIAARVPAAVKAELERMREATGKSWGDVLREAVGVQGASAGEAFQKGFEAGRKRYGVQYGCAVCGKAILVETAEEKAAAAALMRGAGWGHERCGGR